LSPIDNCKQYTAQSSSSSATDAVECLECSPGFILSSDFKNCSQISFYDILYSASSTTPLYVCIVLLVCGGVAAAWYFKIRPGLTVRMVKFPVFLAVELY